MSYNLNYQAPRARKARLARRLTRRVQIVEGSLAGVLAAASLYLILSNHAAGFSSLGIDVLITMLIIWQRWDVSDLTADQSSIQSENVALDQLLEPRLLSNLHSTMTAPQIWMAAVHTWEGMFVLQRLGLPASVVKDIIAASSVSTDTIWSTVINRAQALRAVEVDGGMVVAAIMADLPALEGFLAEEQLKPEDVIAVLLWLERYKAMRKGYKNRPYFGGMARDWAFGYTPLLDQLASNISREVEYGAYRTVPNIHQPAIDQLIGLLAENRPAVLVGGIGSGRTAIVYALAQQIMENRNVGKLSYYQVVSLNATTLISTEMQIENLVMQLLSEAVHAKNTILFLDEAQIFFSSGAGAIDLTQVLLPILQHGSIKVVMAMSDHDWQQLVSTRPSLAATLQRVIVTEPHPDEAMAVLQDEALLVEHRANATTLQEAIRESVKLAIRYLPELALPGKAITVLEAASHYAESGYITAHSVRQAVEAMTGAKVTAATAPERAELLGLEERIHQRMVNQARAVKVVAAALRRSRAGVASPKRPVGSFLFLGPTGVGKTELAKALAAVYFGGEDRMIRLDMSEYQQPSDLSRLLAAQADTQTGGTLVSQVRQNPSSVVLLDEIEKAHPDILNLLLQVLDEGHLTDSDGRSVSFKDAILIATSNAAADDIRARIDRGEQLEAFEEDITRQLIDSHQFRPELLNRFDEIVLFRPLTKDELGQVVTLMMADVNATLREQNVRVELTTGAAAWLAERGYNPALGARPLRRVVQRSVENIVAERLLAGAITPGQTVTLDVKDLETTDTAGV